MYTITLVLLAFACACALPIEKIDDGKIQTVPLDTRVITKSDNLMEIPIEERTGPENRVRHRSKRFVATANFLCQDGYKWAIKGCVKIADYKDMTKDDYVDAE